MNGRKHTTLNLDERLVQAAQAELRTPNVTETIHEALREVVRRRGRRLVREYDFPGLTPESLEASRGAQDILPDRYAEL